MFKYLWKRKKLLVIVLFICSILLVCGWVNSNAQLSQFKQQISKFELKEQKYIETIDGNGKKIVEQEQIILSQKDAITHNLLEISNLKKVKAQVIVNTITKVDSVLVPFVMDSTINDTLTADNYIIIPQRFSLSDEWYAFNGKIKKEGVLIDSLSFNNELKLTIGSKSMGLLKSPKPIVLVEYSNPYISTTGMQNIVIKNELKWYEKKTLWFGVGFGAGIGTAIILSK